MPTMYVYVWLCMTVYDYVLLVGLCMKPKNATKKQIFNNPKTSKLCACCSINDSPRLIIIKSVIILKINHSQHLGNITAQPKLQSLNV